MTYHYKQQAKNMCMRNMTLHKLLLYALAGMVLNYSIRGEKCKKFKLGI